MELEFFMMTPEKLTRNNIILLICLFVIILFFPVISVHRKLIGKLIFTAIIVSGCFSLDFRPKTRRILIASGAVTILFNWSSHFFTSDLFRLTDFLAFFCFNVFIAVFMIRHIFRSKKVTGTIIINSVNGYLLIGVLGAVMLAMTEIVQKFFFRTGAVAINFAGKAAVGFHDYLYFSFVTLTTLGYGDVTPVSSLAKSITLFIAITGQLYLTILIAMLVGKYLSRSEKV